MRTQNEGKDKKPEKKAAGAPKSAAQRIKKLELSDEELAKVSGGNRLPKAGWDQ